MCEKDPMAINFSGFGEVYKITFSKLTPTYTTKAYYKRPSLVDMQFEESYHMFSAS